MWADTFLHAQQQHLLRLLLWAALCLLGATAVALLLVVRRLRSPLLTHFAIQTGAWGVAIAGIASIGWRSARLPDLGGAARIERMVWMNIGLDIGFAAVGVVLALTAWTAARKLSGVGAGIAIVVQGVALLVLDLQFAAIVSR